MLKKVCLYLILCAYMLVSASADGLLPELNQVLDVEMPSMRIVMRRDADEENITEDGGTCVVFEDVSEKELDQFSQYLEDCGCILANYSLNGEILNATIEKDGKQFLMNYDYENGKTELLYPQGTVEQWSSYSQYNVEKFGIGNTVLFGSYEQDNDLSNGKEEIEWLVLDSKDGKALLLSKYILDAKDAYHEKFVYDVTWETCTLRSWLNNQFIRDAFSSEEQKMIQLTTVNADKNPEYINTNQGNATEDKVFLLSVTEAEKYFASSSMRSCEPTAFTEAKGIKPSYWSRKDRFFHWWLRTKGRDYDKACSVWADGDINTSGEFASISLSYPLGIRPALWITY